MMEVGVNIDLTYLGARVGTRDKDKDKGGINNQTRHHREDEYQ
jgi:hypothetical protein